MSANTSAARTVSCVEDVEKQQLHLSQEDGNTASAQIIHLQSLFGLPEDRLHLFPGAASYCCFLETCFQPLLTDEFACIWSAIGEQNPESVRQCWPLFDGVCSTIRSLRDESSSIEEVWNRLSHLSSEGKGRNPAKGGAQDPGFIAVFSALCWATMTLEPNIRLSDFKGSPSLMVCQQPLEDGLPMEFVRRPIPAVFRQFRRAMLSTRWRAPIGESKANKPTVLEVACLNYASLHRIGKIRLEWANDLTSHLDFDANKRILYVFRFPSFCALSILTESFAPSVPILEGLVRALYGIEADANKEPFDNAQLHQEVLMSYRLLFGQQAGSRRLVKESLRALREDQPNEYDSFLDVVCDQKLGRKVRSLPLSLWPVTCRSFEGQLQEENAYSSQDDFPMFGARLAKLQEFTLRQKPSRLRDLWLDRRNPLQWYTFWAVLVFGGLSNLLALLQFVTGVAQVALTVKQPCQC